MKRFLIIILLLSVGFVQISYAGRLRDAAMAGKQSHYQLQQEFGIEPTSKSMQQTAYQPVDEIPQQEAVIASTIDTPLRDVVNESRARQVQLTQELQPVLPDYRRFPGQGGKSDPSLPIIAGLFAHTPNWIPQATNPISSVQTGRSIFCCQVVIRSK